MKSGTWYEPLSVRNRKRSSVTGALSGASSCCQSGISSFSARGSITAPERMCAPTSEPFSSTQTLISCCCSRGELLQADRRGQPGGAGADDDDVVLHRFALSHFSPSMKTLDDIIKRVAVSCAREQRDVVNRDME